MPEFTNPLFLKLFCKGVKENGWTRVPLGLRGITAILDMLLDATNRKLSDPKRMDYDRASNPVKKAIDVLVRLMAKSGKRWVPRAQAVQAVNQIYKVDGYDRSLFRNLVAEGILAESRWSTQEGNIEIVSFVYERFGDHLLARHFIDTSLDRKALKRSFDPRTKLGKLLKTEADSYQHVGLIEALSVQIPEIIRRELFEIAPHASKFDIVDEAFLKSLVWRASNAFTKATFNRANDLIQDNSASGDILNAALTVAPVPDHPLNANKLHRVLLRLKMADRDAWWSIFLHSEWRGGRAVSRLIDWTLGESNKSDLEEPVVLLTGTAISWFLTSSNRFLRDRATKALVKLFENRLATLQVLLDRFWTVNDPYVLERLLAASYGCVMRSQDKSGLTELAADVSKHMFQKMKVLPQLLTRDYARGIIDCARQWGVVPADAFPESQPPYGSKWPNMKMPDSQSLAKWGEWRKGEPDADWAQREVYSSVMGNGLSDFSHYVIGDLHEWTSVRLGVKPPQTVKEQFDEFVTNLRPVQRKALDQFRIVSDNVRLCRRLSPEEQKEHFEGPFTDDQLNVVLADAEKRIITLLKGTPASKRVFETVAKPYIDDPHQYRLPYTFDGTVARRWMVQRIIDYGWTTKRFGEFDRMVNRWSYSGREASKPERIGKKYQWIAYHELLARLSDNFYMRKDAFSDHGLREYSGPWDSRCGSARDIDPSIVVRSTPTDDELAGRAWWSPIAYSGWRAPVEDADWLRDTNDLPAVETLLSVRSPHDDSQWFVLDTHVEWKQPAKPGHKNYELPQRDLWCIIGSYLVRRADAATFFRWAKRQDFMGRWMPESVGVYHIFFGEYFWAPAYREIINEYQTDGWTRGSFDRVPTDVLVTSLDFVNESSGFDCSIDASLQIKIPAPAIANGMQLRWSGSEGRYIDPAGRLAAFDPSVFEPGPGALLVRQDALKRYLADNGLELFWTLLGEKRLIGGNSRSEFGWLELSGIYRLTGDGIVGKLSAEHEIGPRPQRRSRRKK
jgi:hypothetical protein